MDCHETNSNIYTTAFLTLQVEICCTIYAYRSPHLADEKYNASKVGNAPNVLNISVPYIADAVPTDSFTQDHKKYLTEIRKKCTYKL